ncbi:MULTISPECIES: EF-hand domain-containing protein [unclassified Streptomyces]|uniref:EF-hand domain-containing protein n=1 Tax=unclassified Streptomyces TaxID=2593676 RepID=UPI000DB9A0B8|nr:MULTISPECIES: EF-hand domain-containing protein [unclassified Streptomyces]MYT69163.1 calcium sensor EFh [Streptomyces sp. SID8367]RAJ82678.1 Ca2+-binding EF-hand superfamily protein [Streptomyces sp. PsTaAH-137]
MASAFQERKLRGMFTAFDTDGDGYLREDDFRALVNRWLQLSAAAPGTDLGTRVQTLVMGWWAALLEVGDANGDGTVDMDELLALVDKLPAMVDSVTATADTVFDAVDADGDGRISPEEHRRLVETWNGQPTDITGVFELLDLNGDGHLSREEFATLWRQFWISDDPAAPGNWLCGRIPVAG